ncbi:transport permease protein [Actinoplanes cyaneus]|uniref:Transport permease protein n=1 Tax=Actinoplanes cyaneus TaxID=52696 RepID=A0A919ITW9_9ACTN|nr:ABC transporter permease [Actinoplanes cyaneus]MCW2143012.1 ABC-2 type transport system permease protein [Actinoplanes cyaneus]GID69553.1 transport permease protein [Actinoplanes cyaneus]
MTALASTELRLFLRERSGPAFGVGLPILLLIIFGNLPFYHERRDDLGGRTLLDTYVPILVAFSLAMLALNVLPPVLAGYREKGVLRRLRTTPVGPVRVLGAQLVITLVTALVAVTALLLVARFAFGVGLPRQPAGFLIATLLATLALTALGLLVAAAAPGGRAANAIGAAVFYPLVFFGGLFLPVETMPPALARISHATPLGAAVTAMTDATNGHWPHWIALLTLLAWAGGAAAAAAKLFRWE